MAWQTILFEVAEGVATLTLNRPERLNAFVPDMHREVARALTEVEGDDQIRALLLTGAGRSFCAGQDLAARNQSDDPATTARSALDEHYNPLVRRLRALAKPVVAAVNGVAAGGGAGLAFACDVVVAGRSASFLQAFCRIGLIPDVGNTYFLPRLAGTARAMGLALLGDQIPAEQAAEWGLIWKVFDDAALLPEARALAVRLAQGPTRSLGLIKEAIYRSLDNTLDRQLELERDLQGDAAATDDFREGVAAFMAKRPARFVGH
jgi:2-(1,2-epoxy-1,2-dihydrophenyl)acetyl-CoA isomerase